ncbi:hypothetical protein OG304_04645 [Streptomyces sp. NBC_00160]|uniref:hypothetical protein n=1 Tax=Streptomyces sp. NBC_00160 TaxID=2903628 RepID=UPI0022504819|nr:hypothetical protein [Streptomyces sp. NBC_00160]MCX5302741.1 hypothetical protein [Streptomyces sp. NBC_00160]
MVEREWLNEGGHRMVAIMPAEMAELSDEELRLCFRARFAVPGQGAGLAGIRMQLGEDACGDLDALTDRMIEDVVAWVGGQGDSESGDDDLPAE